MNYLSVDYLVVDAFLLITLVIGLQAGRGVKNIRECVLANSRLSTVALVLTFLAAYTGIVNVIDEIETISGAAEELKHRSFEVLHTYSC